MSFKGVLKVSSLNIPDFLSLWVTSALLKMMNSLCLSELETTILESVTLCYFLKISIEPSVAFLGLSTNIFAYSLGLSAQDLQIASCLIQPFHDG